MKFKLKILRNNFAEFLVSPSIPIGNQKKNKNKLILLKSEIKDSINNKAAIVCVSIVYLNFTNMCEYFIEDTNMKAASGSAPHFAANWM